jgi:glutaconate CoA-transferase subunit B
MTATRDEWMTVVAARRLWTGCVCFVGIGLPSEACNLARLTHAPGIVLVYESGTIGTRPDVLPLSIGAGELAAAATGVVPLPEVFAYYLQGGRVDVGFLGAAQIDRFGNLNSTVIGPDAAPTTRLPGAGGAPEIAAHARQTFVMLKATPRSCVARLDCRTSAGFGAGHGARARGTARGDRVAVAGGRCGRNPRTAHRARTRRVAGTQGADAGGACAARRNSRVADEIRILPCGRGFTPQVYR